MNVVLQDPVIKMPSALTHRAHLNVDVIMGTQVKECHVQVRFGVGLSLVHF